MRRCAVWAGPFVLQVEADKARRADRISRDPEFDEAQGVARDYVTREVVRVADST